MSAGKDKINVTPLIDILLVLLIIFIVMMPIVMRLETVDVPPKNDDVLPMQPPVVLKINADTSVTIDDTDTVAGSELAHRVADRVRGAHQVFVDFDDGVPWSDVLHTVDLLRGFSDQPDDIKVAVRMHDDASADR